MIFVLRNKNDCEKIILYLRRISIESSLGYKLRIEPIRKQRSSNQNNYYWGVIIKMLGEQLGYTDEEMHDALRIMFLQEHTDKLTTIKSTTGLNTKDFEDYLSKIRQWASDEMETFLPLPNECILDQEAQNGQGG